jgi:hypothetical protein
MNSKKNCLSTVFYYSKINNYLKETNFIPLQKLIKFIDNE